MRERVKKCANYCKATSLANGAKSIRRALFKVFRRGTEVNDGVGSTKPKDDDFAKIEFSFSD